MLSSHRGKEAGKALDEQPGLTLSGGTHPSPAPMRCIQASDTSWRAISWPSPW